MAWILGSIEASAGYLHGCPVQFAAGLNCIIGARGTCKSTIVETVRFLFNCDPKRVDEMRRPSPPGVAGTSAPRAGLIHETLAGGTAKCELVSPGDPSLASYVLERNVQQDVPSVFRDGVKQVDGTGVLEQIEIYSQGDLQTIAEDAKRRLLLIDRPNQRRVDELAAIRQSVTEELRKLGQRVRERRSEIESRQAKVRELDASKKKLADLQSSRPTLSPELETERVAYEARRKAYERVKIAVEARDRALSAARTLLAEEQPLREGAAAAANAGADSAAGVASAIASLLNPLADLRSAVESSTDLRPVLSALASEFEARSSRYYELRKGQVEVNDALKTEEALRHAVAVMEGVAGELATLSEAQERDLARRADLRSQRDAVSDELYNLRLVQVNGINAAYGRQIVLTLQQGVLTDGHRTLVEELLARSSLRNQSEVARDLAERVLPSDLVDIVEAGDAARLAQTLGRDLGQMTRLVGHLVDNPRLFDLETMIPEDGLEITMVVQGEPRPLNQLSKGQMATALLPLILREAEYPLVIDQPEDDLDNAFVFQYLVARITALSSRRQLVFVTHNANIPVLGEAARVVVMEMSGPRRAAPCRAGTVDEMRVDIIRILEGGTEAFKARHSRYAGALGGT